MKALAKKRIGRYRCEEEDGCSYTRLEIFRPRMAPARNAGPIPPARAGHQTVSFLHDGPEDRGNAGGEMAAMLIDCFQGQIYHWCLTKGSCDLVSTCERLLELLMESLTP